MKKLILRRLSPTVEVLRGFQGNARACITVEPLWGIPYNLFVPYASLYMLALGVSDRQIGTVTAVGLVFQMLFALTGGHFTDKHGRRRTSLIFDCLAWSVSTLIWATARNYHAFLVAAALNGTSKIVKNSWNCLMIEDAPPSQRVHIYTWVEVAAILAGFFAPIAGLLVFRFGLVPAVRGLYAFAFVSMTTMFLTRHAGTRETSIGLVKMVENRHHSLWDSFRELPEALRSLAGDPLMLTAFALAVLNNVHLVLRDTFLGIILNRGLGLPQETLAIFPALGAAVSLGVYLFVMPGLGRRNPTKPLLAGLGLLTAGYGVLLVAPTGGFSSAVAATLAVAIGAAVVTPFVNGNLANRLPDHHRAKTLALVYAGVYGGTAPFGRLAGDLSALNPRLPAVLLILVFAAAAGCVLHMRRAENLR